MCHSIPESGQGVQRATYPLRPARLGRLLDLLSVSGHLRAPPPSHVLSAQLNTLSAACAARPAQPG